MKIIADENIQALESLISPLGELTKLSPKSINPQNLKKADALIIRSVTSVIPSLIENSQIKFIGTTSVGFDNIDTNYLKQKNIYFTNAAGCNANSVVEYVLCSLLYLDSLNKISLKNSKIGIVGVGNIGSLLAKKLQALDIKVLLNDPLKEKTSPSLDLLPLEQLMDCDVITLHVPLTHKEEYKTHLLFDKQMIRQMKKGSILINTSRGEVVDTNALKKHLKSGHLSGAVLDVWPNEPHIDTDLIPFLDIATPHIAGHSYLGKRNGTVIIRNAFCRFFNLQKPEDDFNKAGSQNLKTISITKDINPNNFISELATITQKIYWPINDQKSLEKILNLTKKDHASFFSSLRKNYPKRLEFSQTILDLKTQLPDKEVLSKLKALDFQINTSRE
ncbi:4-phosphoerythronate dehydrogenase [Candidatus Margulisiibacteriota bacterium]